MSFLNQLKTQASALQAQNSAAQASLRSLVQPTENATKTTWLYLEELARQLNVIGPEVVGLSLDGRTPWPAMKLLDFRTDFRRKNFQDKEVYDYLVLSWRMVPKMGMVVSGSVSAVAPGELQRIEDRLASGNIKYERVPVRHPKTNVLQHIRFDYLTEARGSVTVSTNHLEGRLSFRLSGVQGFDVVNVQVPVDQIQTATLDELAKLLVGQVSRFV